jgi:putative addiction module killer protein
MDLIAILGFAGNIGFSSRVARAKSAIWQRLILVNKTGTAAMVGAVKAVRRAPFRCHLKICNLYATVMLEIRRTVAFDRWLRRLKDDRARAKIAARIQRIAFGNFGDVLSVGEGVSELRISEGPGYRVYFVKRGSSVVILLCAGDKKSQERDIKTAKALAKEWKA